MATAPETAMQTMKKDECFRFLKEANKSLQHDVAEYQRGLMLRFTWGVEHTSSSRARGWTA